MDRNALVVPADLFFARIQSGQRFRVWPPAGRHDINAGLILTAADYADHTDAPLHVPFTYPTWTGLGDGAVYRDGADGHRFELVDADATDLCGCGKPGLRHSDPYLLAAGRDADAAARPLLLCPTCLVQVTALAHAD